MQASEFLKEPEWLKNAPEFIQKEWNSLKEFLLDAFLEKFGIHQDEYDNFNSYMPEILNLIKEHVKIQYLDEIRQEFHQIQIKDSCYIKPYDRNYGLDDPEQALLRGNYEGSIRSTIVYTIHTSESVSDVLSDVVIHTEEDFKEEQEEEKEIDEKELEEVEEEEAKAAFGFHNDKYVIFTKLIHEKVIENHLLLELPILLQSCLCNMSSCFYLPSNFSKLYLQMPTYCVSRTFKLCPYEEYYTNNRVLAYVKGKVQIRSRFYQAAKKFRTNSTMETTLSTSKFRKNANWELSHRFLIEIPHEKPKQLLSATVLAMAFGWTSAQFVEAVRYYVKEDNNSNSNSKELNLFLTILETDKENCATQTDALLATGECLAKFRHDKLEGKSEAELLSYVSYNLHNEFLANLVVGSCSQENKDIDYDIENFRKGDALAQSVAELILHSDLMKKHTNINLHDARSYANKRVETPGEKLVILVRKYLKVFTKRASHSFKKLIDDNKKVDINCVFNRKIIKLTKSVKNGVWDSKTDASDSNQNKTQMMITGFCNDANHMQTQKIIKFAVQKNNNPETLLTHPSQTGRVDPYLTPETDKCGIARFKALGCCFSNLVDLENISKLVKLIINSHQDQIGWVPISNYNYPQTKSIYAVYDLYGGIMGFVHKPRELYRIFVSLRRTQILYRYFSIELDTSRCKIYFNCDEGRLMRPLIIAENIPKLHKILKSEYFKSLTDPISYLLNESVIEYLDAAEECCGTLFVGDSIETIANAKVSYSHLEIDGSFILCMGTAKAFANHNQGPRRLQTGNLEKRSIAMKLNVDRGTTDSHTLWYAEDNFISDPVDKALKLRHNEPNGIMMWLFVYSRGNIEDGWEICKSTVELGAGISTKFHIMTTSLSSNCIFSKPDINCKGCASVEKYQHLDNNGFPIVGTILSYGDAVIGKVMLYKDMLTVEKVNPKDKIIPKFTKRYRCSSKFIPWYCEYRVHQVELYPPENPKTVRVTLAQVNLPMVGNKYYLSHGQKGTCGIIVPKEDMPFIASGPNAGITADICTNACGAMRVTSGLHLEMLFGKAKCMKPSLIAQYETLFLSQSCFEDKIQILNHVYKEHGISYRGTDIVRSGKTGEIIKCMIYNGPVKMGTLKHMSKEKLRGRTTGQVQQLTRQAVSSGALLNGAQKFGEMENWALHCWGTVQTFQNMNYHCADKFEILWCNACMIPAIGSVKTGLFFCTNCKKSKDILRVLLPYSSYLLWSETFTASWGLIFNVEKCKENVNENILIVSKK